MSLNKNTQKYAISNVLRNASIALNAEFQIKILQNNFLWNTRYTATAQIMQNHSDRFDSIAKHIVKNEEFQKYFC